MPLSVADRAVLLIASTCVPFFPATRSPEVNRAHQIHIEYYRFNSTNIYSCFALPDLLLFSPLADTPLSSLYVPARRNKDSALSNLHSPLFAGSHAQSEIANHETDLLFDFLSTR